jgi:hypothetical protein
MARQRRWMIRVDVDLARRVELQAEGMGVCLSEYLRSIIEAQALTRGKADHLAQLNTEITLVSGMMIRRLLTHVIGPEDARSLEEWANGRASSVVQGELKSGPES